MNPRRFSFACLTGLTLCLPVAAAAPAAGTSYKIDPVHTSVVFRIKHAGVSYFYGRFNKVAGSFAFDKADPKKAGFDVRIRADSVDTNDRKRDQHLKSPDFFNAKEFPTISFKSRSVESADSESLRVTGDLSLHGVTKSITVEMKHVGSTSGPRGAKCGFEATFTISRSEFGITYGAGALGDDVTLMVGLEGDAQ